MSKKGSCMEKALRKRPILLYTDKPLAVFKTGLNLLKWALFHDFKKGQSGKESRW